jgi:hypothetical protein
MTVPPKPLAMPNVPSMIIYNNKTTFTLTIVPPKPLAMPDVPSYTTKKLHLF